MTDRDRWPRRRIWTEAELRTALHALISAAYGKKENFPMHVPGLPSDADVVLYDCIDEVEAHRAKSRATEATVVVLRRLLRYYRERERTAQRLMNQTTEVEVAARHATSALSWQVRCEVVLQVAKNLDLEMALAAEAEQQAIAKPIRVMVDGGEIVPLPGKDES